MLSTQLAQQLEAALRGLQFGTIQLVVHGAQVVRIERVERIRLTDSSEAPTMFSDTPTPSREVRPHVPEE